MLRKTETSSLIVKMETGNHIRGASVSITTKDDDPKTIVMYQGNNIQAAAQAYGELAMIADGLEALEIAQVVNRPPSLSGR